MSLSSLCSTGGMASRRVFPTHCLKHRNVFIPNSARIYFSFFRSLSDRIMRSFSNLFWAHKFIFLVKRHLKTETASWNIWINVGKQKKTLMHFWKVRCCLDVVAPSHWQPKRLGWELATLPAVTVLKFWCLKCTLQTKHRPHLRGKTASHKRHCAAVSRVAWRWNGTSLNLKQI